jgi:transcriptional regulator GlxA family with amidase domain
MTAERSIGRIALDAGFADHSDFSRHFSATTGVTPTQYRRIQRQASEGTLSNRST